MQVRFNNNGAVRPRANISRTGSRGAHTVSNTAPNDKMSFNVVQTDQRTTTDVNWCLNPGTRQEELIHEHIKETRISR